MFHQLLTPVGNSLLPSFLVAALPIIVVLLLLGWARRPAWQASLAGLIVGLIVAIFVWQFPVGLAINSVAAGAVFACWPVMWIVFTRDPALQHRAALGPLRGLPHVDDRQPAERPARRAGRDRLFVRRAARRDFRLRHAGRDHQFAADPARLSHARSAHLHADLQHRAGRLRRARRADHRARRGHPPAGRLARQNGRPPVAVFRVPAAVLCDRRVCGLSQHAARVAGAAGVRCELRADPVRRVELCELQPDRRAFVDGVADSHHRVPARLETRRRSEVRDQHRSRGRGARQDRRRPGLVSVDHRLGRGDRLDGREDLPDRRRQGAVAGSRQGRVHHAVQHAVRRGLGLPAARHRHGDSGRRHHHGVRRRA